MLQAYCGKSHGCPLSRGILGMTRIERHHHLDQRGCHPFLDDHRVWFPQELEHSIPLYSLLFPFVRLGFVVHGEQAAQEVGR
jgi:hypothetical protein